MGAQARLGNALALVRRINAAIQPAIGLSESPPSLATSFTAFRPSGHQTMSVSLTKATGTGARTEPEGSRRAMTVAPF